MSSKVKLNPMPMLRTSSLFASVCLLICSSVTAETNTTRVTGSFNNSQENACIHVSIFMMLADCTYSRRNAEVAGHTLPWVGPTVNPVYYDPDSAHAVPEYKPVPGDDRIEPSLSGTLTIDDQGTADPADDTISGELTVGPAARSVVVNVNRLTGGPAPGEPRAIMFWSGIEHSLAATGVNSATPNADGGFDYVIASKGFPSRLYRADESDDYFPSALAGRTVEGQDAAGTWNAPSNTGVTRDTAMAGNVGATTTAIMKDYRCVDNRGGVTCPNHNVVWGNGPEPRPGERNMTEAPGFDNLLVRASTDGSGNVSKAQGFWTQEYTLAAGPPNFQVPEDHNNSWQGGYLELFATDPNKE